MHDEQIELLWTTALPAAENNDASAAYHYKHGGTFTSSSAPLISINVSNAYKYANMSANFMHKTTLYVHIIYKNA